MFVHWLCICELLELWGCILFSRRLCWALNQRAYFYISFMIQLRIYMYERSGVNTVNDTPYAWTSNSSVFHRSYNNPPNNLDLLKMSNTFNACINMRGKPRYTYLYHTMWTLKKNINYNTAPFDKILLRFSSTVKYAERFYNVTREFIEVVDRYHKYEE